MMHKLGPINTSAYLEEFSQRDIAEKRLSDNATLLPRESRSVQQSDSKVDIFRQNEYELNESAREIRVKEHVNRAFLRFKAIYGRKFSSEFERKGNDEDKALSELKATKREWVESISTHYANLDAIELETLMNETISELKFTCEWTPSICEFVRKMDEIYLAKTAKIPSLNQAYEEACKNAHKPNKASLAWSHPMVYWCGRETGWSDIHANERTFVFKRFEKNYNAYLQKIRTGTVIELPQQSLNDHQEDTVKDTVTIIKHLANKHGLPAIKADRWFYYLLLSEGKLRDSLKEQAMNEASNEGFQITFPK